MLQKQRAVFSQSLTAVALAILIALLVPTAFATVPSSQAQWQAVLGGSLDGERYHRILQNGGTRLNRPQHRPRELLVRFRQDVTFDTIKSYLESNGATTVRKLRLAQLQAISTAVPEGAPMRRWVHVKLADFMDEQFMRDQLRLRSEFEHVELNHLVRIQLTPNDPSFGLQWGLHNIGQLVGPPGEQSSGTVDADIDAPEAWNAQTGSTGVRVAVIDSGIDYLHPDLSANIWINTAEKNGLPGVDDDANGYVDDINGYDFVNSDSDPMDDNGHGTHVSGTIAAKGNNGMGVTGTSWKASLMSLKFLDSTGSGSTSDAVEAVLYAASMGAKIINASWLGTEYSQALFDAINVANSSGVLFVAAAGNGGFDLIGDDNDSIVVYPANYHAANILSVSASDQNDALTAFSNYGGVSVDLSAPGSKIYSTLPNNTYGYLDGTSMAAPHVAGVAALMLAQNSARPPLALKALIMARADIIPGQNGKSVMGGRLNAKKVLNCASLKVDMIALSPADNFKVTIDSVYHDRPPVNLVAQVHVCGNMPSVAAKTRVTFSNGDRAVSLFDDGLHGDYAAGDGIFANTWAPSRAGTVTLTFKASVASGPNIGSVSKLRSGEAIEDDDDFDGLTNLFENSIGSNPLVPDTDGDTLPDGVEVAYDGNATSYTPYPGGGDLLVTPDGLDTDGDGDSDGVEYDYAGNGANPAVRAWSHEFTNKPSARYGSGFAALTDVNGDGRPDYAVGEPPGLNGQTGVAGGSVYVYSGATRQLLYTIPGPMDVVDLGLRVAAAGNVNGDGIGDIAAASGYSTASASYSVFIYSGSDGALLKRFDFASLNPGWITLAAGADVNADQVPDLLIGLDALRRVDVVSGADGSVIRSITVNSGIYSLAFDEDFNVDGVRDLLLGSPYHSTNGLFWNGSLFVYSGANGVLLRQLDGAKSGDVFATAVAGIRDLNGDSVPDILVTSPGIFSSPFRVGTAFIYSGANGALLRQHQGTTVIDWFGTAIARFNLGDDALDDVLITANLGDRFDNNNALNNGEIYVFHGSTGVTALRIHGNGAGLLNGAVSAGDLNGDGIDDLLYGYWPGSMHTLVSP